MNKISIICGKPKDAHALVCVVVFNCLFIVGLATSQGVLVLYARHFCVLFCTEIEDNSQ